MKDPVSKLFDSPSSSYRWLSSILFKRNPNENKRYVSEWYESTEKHSGFGLTFKELFQMIITIIENHPQKIDMKERLKTELNDSVGMCFTGRMNRTVNALVGFIDGIQIGLSVKEEIQLKISAIVKKIMDKKINKKQSKKEMEEIFKDVGEKDGISESYKIANILALDDYFDDDEDDDNSDNNKNHIDVEEHMSLIQNVIF